MNKTQIGRSFTFDCAILFLVCSSKNLLVENFRLLVLPLFQITGGEVILCLGYIWIVRSQFRLVNFQRSPVISLHLLIFTLHGIKTRKLE